MKGHKFFTVMVLAAAVVLGGAGCGTTSPNVSKDRGVYTTVAMEGQNLDLPATGYTSCKIFGPSQTPAAVVVGYGYWDGSYNHPQDFKLEVVEVASGTVILNLNGNVYAGKATYVNLPIRKSGDYRLRLVVNGSVYDTWDFTVNREGAGGETPTTAAKPEYARGDFSASIVNTPDAFVTYDEYLLQALTDALLKEKRNSSQDAFAQTPAGEVVVQFDLSEAGLVSSAKILENTLNDALGQFYLRALAGGAPYKAWAAAERTAFGSGSRTVQVTFYYE
jgi:hypothetical protein